MSNSVVRDKSYRFALAVIGLYRTLVSQREFILSKQMLRSGTSIGANVEEALAAQSRRDFTAKMSVASKEARECHYWLRLLRDSDAVPREVVLPLIKDCDELIRMLTSIVKTMQGEPRE